jgi:hypothetical protein
VEMDTSQPSASKCVFTCSAISGWASHDRARPSFSARSATATGWRCSTYSVSAVWGIALRLSAQTELSRTGRGKLGWALGLGPIGASA